MRCETCKFFDAEGENWVLGDGFCRRKPPNTFWWVSQEQIVTAFPEVRKNDWCGEYEKKADKVELSYSESNSKIAGKGILVGGTKK